MRLIAQLELEAALRHLKPENPEQDLRCKALSGTGLERLVHLPGSILAWLGARDQWFDATVRRQVLPGHARVAMLGAGLDPRFSRLPQGLLGEGQIVLIDDPAILEQRTTRLHTIGLAEPPQIQHTASELHTLTEVCASLRHAIAQGGRAWSVLAVGLVPHWGAEGIEALITLLSTIASDERQATDKILFGFDWFGAGFADLPEGLSKPLALYGEPLGFHPLGLELWLKALGARHVETVCLMRHGATEAGFATWVEV